MGNLNIQDKKSYRQLFLYSLEASHIRVEMLEEMRQRWKQRGRPLYMIPREFKEGILQDMDSEIKLNYLKWSTSGLEIDMLIMFLTLALFAKDTVEKRVGITFKVFSIDSEENMSDIELRYLIEKTLCALSNTLSIKRDHLFEIYKTIESRIPFKKVYNEQAFQELIGKLLRELTFVLEECCQQITHIVKNLKEEKISKYFEVGNLFLGKYKITSIVSYRSKSHSKGSLSLLSHTNTNIHLNSVDKDQSSEHSISSEGSESHDLEEDKDSDDYKYELDNNKDNMLKHLHVYNLEYSYRIRTQDMFSTDEKHKSFDIFILDDWKFEEYFLFSNVWRETLLLHSMNEEQILKVDDFGQLPGDIIFRETEDFHLYTLEDYLNNAIQHKDADNDESLEESKDMDNFDQDSQINGQTSIFKRKSTTMTEYDTIEVVLKVINLLEILHSKGIIHTNINPGEIFFKSIDDLDTLCFNSLYHCSWDAKKLLKKKIEKTEENLSLFDLRLRRKEYLSPEQIELGERYEIILKEHNGKIDMEKPELIEFYNQAKKRLSISCDIFSIGVIMFRCLIGTTPTLTFYKCLKNVGDQRPTDNIYNPPSYLQKYILSNDMCYILSRLLNPDPSRRYSSLPEVRRVLYDLQQNIVSTPSIIRDVFGHPKVPNRESSDSDSDEISPKKRRKSEDKDDPSVKDFRVTKLTEFTLKYLAKFIYESDVKFARINGGKLPLEHLKENKIVDLNLSKCNLYSEDIFILSRFIGSNITKLNLSQNNIGYKYLEESKVIELKMQHQDKTKDHNFEELFYDSLGIEYLSIALSKRSQLEYVDLSDNDIGPKSFNLLLKVFEVNDEITFVNIADCKIDGKVATDLCAILTNNNKLKSLLIRNCKIEDSGAEAVAKMIGKHNSLQELELFNCGISELGGQFIGEALKTNFCIEKLSIGDNNLDHKDVQNIQQSVIFNTQYNQLKESNRKFEGFAHNLISESIKCWAAKSDFVTDKLMIRLQHPQDELDKKIAEIMLDNNGKMSLDPVPKKYEYSTGDGKITY